MTTDVVLLSDSPAYRNTLGEGFIVHEAHKTGIEGLPAEVRANARILITSGFTGASAAQMDQLPKLGLICCLGTGYENIDVKAALSRGLTVTHGAGTNAAAVADHAMGMLLAMMRDMPRADRLARQGTWRNDLGPRPTATGKHLGIIGLGGIGERIARRAEGFEMKISYTTRTPRPQVPWTHVPNVLDLARQVDALIVAAPGGASTYHMINAEVLEALGPKGVLVNIGRGSVVDTEALVAALKANTILGAALDVFEQEPHIPEELRALDNVILTPHMASWAPEVRQASVELLQRNVALFLAGQPVASAIPEHRAA
ncbi:2-hydroxyacid dehydrogenase [Rhodovarius crocodyli]|uniref:2-hydroxyacid dehydrogenase n=1 Tax=Rhodovarius crocodyli TaxID=1979269 RepID=A0A437MD74_9PROT|nr:2-hydroxyacid dehydrogenase [Rhodovarius crocodyli]RVT95592.1 2-hydroxyacid dehydrogenase [Rhodovarius crocodyli]